MSQPQHVSEFLTDAHEDLVSQPERRECARMRAGMSAAEAIEFQGITGAMPEEITGDVRRAALRIRKKINNTTPADVPTGNTQTL